MRFFLRSVFLPILLLTAVGLKAQECPQVFNPVVDEDGRTFLNACYAEMAGVTFFTQGVAFSDCINPALFDANRTCSQDYQPVVGCNGAIYANICEAEKHGVTSYMPQGAYAMSNGDIDGCFDYQRVPMAFPGAVNYTNGLVNINCNSQSAEPVCGCNGVQYRNPCEAEASGVVDYSYGLCGLSACIDATKINTGEPETCPQVFDPVCGCNNMTYVNQCAANASGVQATTAGTCANAAWQAKAQVLVPGQMKDGTISVASGNDLSNYSCTSSPLAGYENVYVIHKVAPGDLQVEMEIQTQSADLDLFVLNGMGTVECLGMSVGPPNQNIERVTLTDAPIGTYFVVVDAQYRTTVGSYSIQAATGYLDANEIVEINCGIPMSTSNATGSNDLITFNCSQQRIGSGREMVYSFTTAEDGTVTIDLFNQTAPMELYLLDGLDRMDCVDMSANQGNTPESITATLEAGTYYVVVDGDNNAVGNYMLNVSCPAACAIDVPVIVDNTQCGVNSGTIKIGVDRAQSDFLYLLDGPISDCGGSRTPDYDFENLPPGMYNLTVLDMYGCKSEQEIPVYQGDFNFMFLASLTNNGVLCNMRGGQPPYQIFMNNTLIATTSDLTYVIPNIPAGQHEIVVTDSQTCMQRQMVTSAPLCGLVMTATGSPASCSASGSIAVNVTNGTAPYNVTVNGTAYGPYTNSSFVIPNLGAGTYNVTVTEGGGCVATESASILNNGSLTINSATTVDQSCSTPGSITVNVSGGATSYTATLSGAAAGTYTSSPFTIPNVGAGTYTLVITDNAGCTDQTSVVVAYAGTGLTLSATPTAASCNSAGTIVVDATGGTGPYTATLNGVAAGGSFPNNWFTLTNVFAGTYTLVVTDGNGCTGTSQVTVTDSGGSLSLSPTPTAASCGSLGSISIDVAGGVGPYTATLNGVPAGGPWANNWFQIDNVAAGTYTLVVTDGNGCTGTSQVIIANSGGNISISATPTGASCGGTGSITVDATGGTAPFTATLNGVPAGGPFPNNWFTLTNVTAGTYTLVVTDGNGCTGTSQVTVTNSGGNISISATPTGASCGGTGSITVDATGGTAPFTATLNGVPAGGPFPNNWFTLTNVTAGTYTLVVTDGNGCTGTSQVTVTNSGGNISINATPTGASCGGTGSIAVDATGGTAPFTATLNGVPAGGPFNNNWFTLTNVTAGTYTLVVTDGNGCTGTSQVTVTNSGGNISINATPTGASCGGTGSIAVDATGGTAPFTATLNGVPAGGPFNNNWFTLSNVTVGTYTLVVTDGNGCTGTSQVTVSNLGGGNLTVNATSTAAGCGSTGSIAVDVTGGSPNYTATLNGVPAGGPFANNWFTLSNVIAGNYTLVITDGNGCTGTTNILVSGGGSGNVNLTTTSSSASCGSTGSIQLDIAGGTAPFDVFLDGNLVTNTTNRWYIIQNVAAGSHTVRVVDANGCEDTTTSIVGGGSGGNFTVTTTVSGGGCGSTATVGVDVTGSNPPYTVTVNGNNVGTANQNWFNLTGVPPGTHTVVLTNSSGCTGTTQVTVNGGGSGNLNVTASTTGAGCGSTGSIQLDIAGGTAPFDVYVDGTLVTNTTNRWYIIQNLAAGTYSVRVVDANGCEDTITKTVSGNGGGFTITTTPSGAGCSSLGSIGVDVIGGTPTFTVRLDGNIVGTSNQTWFNVVNVPAGTYTLEVTDANGCTATNQVTVGGGGSNNLNVTGSSTTASCSSPATTQLDIQGGVAPFDIFLDGTLVTNTTNRWYVIQNVSAGPHTVEVVDANGCRDVYKYNVSGSGGNLSVTATSSAASCSSPGMIQLDIQGGNPPFQIDLDGNFVILTTNRWYVIQDVTAGNHEIEITDLNGCSTIIWEDVSGTGGNLSATATSTTASCSSPGSIQLDIQGGVAPFDIEVDGNFVTNTSNRWYEILNVAAGSREIKITDKNGCSITIWETVGGGSNLTFTTTPTGAMCSTGGTIQLEITGGDGPFDVELDGNFVTNTNDRWYEILNVAQGSHTVTVTDKNGCTSTRTQNVSGSNGNIILTATHTSGTCTGGGKIMLDIQGGMGPFDVVMDGVFIINTTDRWYTITNVGSGTHNIEITDKNGCTATTIEVVSGSNGFSLVGDVTQGTCGFDKGQIDVTISGGTAPFDVFFDGVLKGNTSIRNHNWTNLSPGTYLVEVIDKTGCSRTFTGTINSSVGTQFTSTITSAGCNGNDGSVKIDITSGDAPFDIWLDGNVITTITGTTYTYTNLATGDYQIGVEDANGCETAEDITISGAASVSVSANSTDAGCGANDGTIVVAIVGGTAPYEIFVDGVSTTTTSDLTYTIDNLAPGTYEVNVVDKNGCSDLTIEKINGNGANIGLDVSTTDAGCGSTGSIKMDILTGDAPFTISLDGNVVATTSDATYTIDGLAPGDYDVKVEGANGCDESFSRTIGGTTANIVLTGTTTACGCGATDGKISLDMTGGTSPYDIFVDGVLVGSTIANDFTVTNLAPGDYDVKVVDKNGCDATASYNVQQAPGVTITTNSTACGCNGLTGSISVDLSGGTAPYDIFLDGTFITATFNSSYTIAGLGQGTYTVKAVDDNNCDASVTETVQHFSDLDFTTIVTDAACGSMNGEITVDITAGSAPYQIYLNGNLVTTTSNNPSYTITGLAGGSYVVRVSDANTCDKTTSVTINGSSSNLSINATASPENCGAMDGNIAVDIIGGDPDFEIYLDGVLLTTISDRWYDAMNLTVGTYTLRVVDRNGCEVVETLTVTGNTSINTSTSATNSSCGNTNGTITVDNTGGLAPYVIFLDGNNVGSTFNQLFTIAGLAPGMYDLRVEDANGCFAELTETVNGGGSLAFSTDITAEACGMLGSAVVNISTGTAPFDIFVDGNLATTTSNNSTTVTDLSSGNYEIRVKDAGGCESIQTIFVRSAPTLDFEVNPMPDTCGGNGFAWVEFLSGTAPYTISLDGNVIATTSDNSYTIDDLSSGGYIVKVTDSQGCSDEIVVMMNNTNNQPSAGFTYMFRPGGVVKLFSNNVNGTVEWDFDDGTTSTELNPIHTFDVDSTYKVCIQATNGCGTSDFCEVLNIPSVYSSNLSFNVANIDGRPGEIIEVPVTVENFDRVTSFQFSLKVGSGAYARMVEVDEGNMTNFESHIMNDETITVTWESDSADGTTMANGETIFTMKLELMGDRGDCTPIDFVTNPMTIQVMQKWFAQPTLVLPNFFAGQVCINEMVSVSGNVHREDQRSIPDVAITCNGSQSIMSDPTTGEFTFPNVGMGDNCLLLPEKDGDDRMALTVKDLLAIRAHILETQNLNSPYKIIAADMDRNQRLDGNDLSVLADLILANQSSMISGDSWRFIPSNHIFDNPTDPFSSVFPVMIDLRNVDHDMSDNDFTGMKLGDVDYSLNLNTMHDTDYNMTDNVMFETVDQSVTAGEEFEMNITSANFENIRGFQFELSFNTDKFEFAGMVPGTLIGLDHNMVGTDQLNDGILPILWYDRDLIANGVTRADDEVLFRLKFRAKEDVSTLEGSFELGKTLVEDLAVDIFDKNLDIYFMVGNAVSAVGEQEEEAQFVLHQNFPNPFSLETTIAFELPTPQEVRLELIDQTGKTVEVKEGFFPQGAQQMIVRGEDLPVSGIYFYRLTVGEKSETNKLIFMKR